MNIRTSTERYYDWLRTYLVLDQGDLRIKHREMSKTPHAFLRATFYRWAEWWREADRTFTEAPTLLAVGDLHVENFGTWRDVEGRLVWGVNDFDEACELPYTMDLVRLAASARLSIEEDALPIRYPDACAALLSGYRKGLERGRPFILAESHEWMRELALKRLQAPGKPGIADEFQEFVQELRETPRLRKSQVPKQARAALDAGFATPVPKYRTIHREAGLGSRGRQRFAAVVDDWYGGMIVREAKALAPSAWYCPERVPRKCIRYEEILTRARRCLDPWVKVHRGWIVRRLAPDTGKLKMKSMPKHRVHDIFTAMGHETANIHQGSVRRIGSVREDLLARDEDWLHQAGAEMVERVHAELSEWRAHWQEWQSVWDQQWKAWETP